MTTLRGLLGKVKDGARENPFGVPAEARLDAQRERTRPKEESPAAVRVAPKAFPPGTKLLGLRIDVDTHEGMRDGVPKLLAVLGEAGVKGTFYFAMGPDRSGLALVNVFTRPGFLAKMLRSGAPKIYSLRTMLSGTLLPSRPVAMAFPEIAKRAEAEGHETGVHAWDHRAWQDRLNRFPEERIILELERGAEAYAATLAVAGTPGEASSAATPTGAPVEATPLRGRSDAPLAGSSASTAGNNSECASRLTTARAIGSGRQGRRQLWQRL